MKKTRRSKKKQNKEKKSKIYFNYDSNGDWYTDSNCDTDSLFDEDKSSGKLILTLVLNNTNHIVKYSQ